MVLWSDVHGRYMWWIMTQVGELCYSLHSELLCADIDKYRTWNLYMKYSSFVKIQRWQ